MDICGHSKKLFDVSHQANGEAHEDEGEVGFCCFMLF